MKMPEPMMPPITMRAASRVPRRRSSLGEDCGHACISNVLPHRSREHRGADAAAARTAAAVSAAGNAAAARERLLPRLVTRGAQGAATARLTRNAGRAYRSRAFDRDDDAGRDHRFSLHNCGWLD